MVQIGPHLVCVRGCVSGPTREIIKDTHCMHGNTRSISVAPKLKGFVLLVLEVYSFPSKQDTKIASTKLHETVRGDVAAVFQVQSH